jgi:GT2 family glycosyltransferase
LSPNETYPQHVVTAVIVAHDGAVWLPHVIDSLLEQTRPVQRVVAVDTGSRDRSGAILAGKLGQAVVFGMDRGTGYGAAVTRALQHKAANVNVPGATALQQNERAEWIWLLHDDCEPAPDALEQLLRGVAETRAAAVLGPKVKDWADRDVILEAGVTIDTVGRRITGIEPREIDQGQHDGDRDATAVGSAGMLIRRDVWEQVGGFDTSMAMFMEDVDFCWRVHSAGCRVRVITDAVVYHAQASTRNRRQISVGRRPRMLDRRNSLLTLLGNLPAGPMLASLAGNVAVSVLRTLFFLVAKRPTAALDEIGAVASVLGHPVRLAKARGRRSRGRRPAYGRLRADLPRGRSLRRIAEFAAAASSRSAQVDTAGSHHATDDPLDDDSLLTDTGLAQRILSSPSVLLVIALTIIAVVAERSLIGSGPLGGGGLVPAWGGASGLWQDYLQGFHPSGLGSSTSVPPYLAIVAVVATLLGGKPWLAVDVILLGCVPLAGISAFLATRRITRLATVRVWGAATYALLPVATGAVAAGRIGTAAVFVLLPLAGLLAGRMFSQPPRRARRAAWATGLVVTLGAAFVPLVWGMALIGAAVAALAFGKVRPRTMGNLGIVVLVPPVLLMPWTLQVAAHPSSFLLEAGLQPPGLASAHLPARSLLLLSPGGPGLPPFWVTAGLALAALAALLASRQRVLVMAGWGVAVLGLLAAIAISHASVRPATGESAIVGWPGPALAIAAIGLLLAAVAAGDGLYRLAASRGSGLRGLASPRRAGAALLAIAACSAPVLAAVFWVTTGVKGPVAPTKGRTVPEIVSVSASNGLQLRTLVLRSSGGQVAYSLLRGPSPSMADPDLVVPPAAEQALNAAVATLVAPGGGQAAAQSNALAQLDIGFVLMRAPVNQSLATLLDGVAGLRSVSTTAAFDLWRLDTLPARVQVVEPGGKVVPVPSGQVSVSGAAAPVTGGTLELAEPVGGWSASLGGRALTAIPSPAGSWAQAFRLPPGGGTLDLSHSGFAHGIVVALEALAVAVVAVLALPGVRTVAEEAAGGGASKDSAAVTEAEPGQSEDSRGTGRPRGRTGTRGGRSSRRPRKGKNGQPGQRRSRLEAAPRRAAAAAGRRAAESAGMPAEQPVGQLSGAMPPAGQFGAMPPAGQFGAMPPAGQFGAMPPAGPSAGPRGGQPGARPAGPRYAAIPPPRQSPSGSWPPAEDPAAIPSPQRSPSGSWPPAEDPAAGLPRRGAAAPSPYPESAASTPAPPAGWPGTGRPAGQPPAQAENWPSADPPAGWQAAGRQPDWPAAQQPSSWPAADQHPSWPAGQQPSGWPAADQQPGWPADQQPAWSADQQPAWPSADPAAGWPSGNGDVLEPLPPAGEMQPGWARPAVDELSAPRWPAPDQEPEGDDW